MKKKQNTQFLIKSSFLISFLLISLFPAFAQFNPFLKTSGSIENNKTILIVFDASASMEEKINNETKIHIAKRVLEDVLLKAARDINLGLRVYGSENPRGNLSQDCFDSKLAVVPGINNRRTIVSEINKILPRGFTPITFSLSRATQDLIPFNGEKSIILISDGLETCGGDPCKLSGEINMSNIDLKIDVVGFGIKDDLEAQNQLMCIAFSTMGKYFSANDADELTRGLDESINKSVTGKIITKPQKPLLIPVLPVRK